MMFFGWRDLLFKFFSPPPSPPIGPPYAETLPPSNAFVAARELGVDMTPMDWKSLLEADHSGGHPLPSPSSTNQSEVSLVPPLDLCRVVEPSLVTYFAPGIQIGYRRFSGIVNG